MLTNLWCSLPEWLDQMGQAGSDELVYSHCHLSDESTIYPPERSSHAMDYSPLTCRTLRFPLQLTCSGSLEAGVLSHALLSFKCTWFSTTAPRICCVIQEPLKKLLKIIPPMFFSFFFIASKHVVKSEPLRLYENQKGAK